MSDATPAGIRAALDAAGLRCAALNALQRTNDWTADRAAEATALADAAATLGAPGIVLCPVIDEKLDWDAAERIARLTDALSRLAPILSDRGLLGYVEPLGMAGSTLTRQDEAVAAMDDAGPAPFALCHDTFQVWRAGDDGLHPDRVGLVHVSGIERTDLGPRALTEPDRVLVGPADRSGALDQLRALVAAGYGGVVSLEPFAPAVTDRPDPAALAASLARIAAAAATAARPETAAP